MGRTFTIEEARELVPAVHAHVERLAALRADLADAQTALRRGSPPEIGGLAEIKSMEAHLQEAVDWLTDRGIQVKGVAPVIVDFPSELQGRAVLLCWLEGEQRLEWYHPAETGFMARRRLADADR